MAVCLPTQKAIALPVPVGDVQTGRFHEAHEGVLPIRAADQGSYGDVLVEQTAGDIFL